MTKMKLVLKEPKDIFEPGRHECCFVRSMLRLEDIWPAGPDISEEGDQHLIDTTLASVAALNRYIDEDDDGTPEYDAYRRTLALCVAVLVGLIKPPPPHSYWELRTGDLRRGIYVSKPAIDRRLKEERDRRGLRK